MPCVCSSNGVKSITSRMGPRRKYGIICAKSGSHVFSVSILSLLKNRSNRRSMLLAFASLSANSSSATCGITILLALIAPNTNSASVLLWCPCNCVKNCLTCSCQTWHNGLNASIEIVFFHLDFGFCSILTISCVLRFSFSSNVSLLSRWSGLFHSLYSSFAIYCSLYITKKGSVGEIARVAPRSAWANCRLWPLRQHALLAQSAEGPRAFGHPQSNASPPIVLAIGVPCDPLSLPLSESAYSSTSDPRF